MNFIGTMEDPQVRVELKYCERCGGLFLRPEAGRATYCAGCATYLAKSRDGGEAPTTVRRRKPRLPRNTRRAQLGRDLRGVGQLDYLQGVAELEVRA